MSVHPAKTEADGARREQHRGSLLPSAGACGLLALLLIADLVVGARTFFIPHARGDQRMYVGLAMKLDRGGMASYNLRQIALTHRGPFLIYTNSSEGQQLLGLLATEGTPYYDQPLFHQPPLFPLMIVGAHRVYAADQPYAVLATTFPTARLVSRADRFVAQDYACIVPLLSGLLLVVCCFALGKLLFNDTVGLVAALLLSVSPAFIQASQRIWADTMFGLFVALTFLFIHLYAERGKTVYLLLSSVSLALSLLTKNYAALTLVPFTLTCGLVVCARQDRRNAAIGLVASLLVVALLTLPWYWLLTRTLGSPWFGPRPARIDAASVWLAYLKAKPWYTYLVGIPCQAPAYLFGFGTMVGFAFTAKRKIDAISLSSWFLCYLAALTYITWHDETLGPEHRYMLPAYPALAILSGLGLVNARDFLATRIGATVATLIVSLALLGSVAWSLWVAAQFLNADVINLPF